MIESQISRRLSLIYLLRYALNSFFIEIDFKFNVQKKSLNLLIHTFAIVKKQHLHKITP